MTTNKDENALWHWLRTSRVRWLLYLLVGELVLAYSIPRGILEDLPTLAGFINAMSQIAPVIDKIGPPYAPNPGPVKLYLAITLCFFPLKVWFFYIWLNSDRIGLYRHLVVSPNTDTTPATPDELITEPLRKGEGAKPKDKKRSWFSRLFWSILILAISVGFLVSSLIGIEPDTADYKIRLSYRSLGAAGWPMWFQWIVKEQLINSFLSAVSLSILRDYGLTVIHFYNRFRDRRSS